ncbi:hypothetical protein CDL12_27766 [Handroanthus impetiginosus]|uniref:Bet v I/Major latex protein domain-containing protein n=1 Tax=Handroanthus impetiginosus TaxID=429701 RepID=A0A2G9G345_9LAMI|nr:hypothetical protein CDL12_27766 [Handroanthus impetiginosus]
MSTMLLSSIVITQLLWHSPPDRFYNFFKSNLADLVKIFPAGFTEFQLIEGTAGTVGNVYQAIDDDARSITFNCLEGDVLQLHSVFNATLDVSDGSARWTFTYERRTILTPPPVLYVAFAIKMSTLVDAYLLIN